LRQTAAQMIEFSLATERFFRHKRASEIREFSHQVRRQNKGFLTSNAQAKQRDFRIKRASIFGSWFVVHSS
jgi:hypothetical protein